MYLPMFSFLMNPSNRTCYEFLRILDFLGEMLIQRLTILRWIRIRYGVYRFSVCITHFGFRFTVVWTHLHTQFFNHHWCAQLDLQEDAMSMMPARISSGSALQFSINFFRSGSSCAAGICHPAASAPHSAPSVLKTSLFPEDSCTCSNPVSPIVYLQENTGRRTGLSCKLRECASRCISENTVHQPACYAQSKMRNGWRWVQLGPLIRLRLSSVAGKNI